MSSQGKISSGDGQDAELDELLDRFVEPRRNTRQATGDSRTHSDADSIRRYFGVSAYDGAVFDYENLMPNVLEYSWDSGPKRVRGGTDLLGTGKPGSGKSTFLNHLSLRGIEVPESRVVWRASPSRSEWLPLAPWVTLCLPSETEFDIRLEPRRPTESRYRLDVDDLERIVRDVVYYDDVRELNSEILENGRIHVVYPDRQMRGLEEAYLRSEKRVDDDAMPDDRGLFDSMDPNKHFWFGWVLDRVENGPHYWTTLVLDEIGDIAPESAGKDSFGTLQKIELLTECWVDARKKGLSIYSFGHSERDIHNLIRHKIRWRVTMNGIANPTSSGNVIGVEKVPMNTDMTSRMDVGKALIWNEQNFEKIAWPDYSAPVSHKLELRTVGVA